MTSMNQSLGARHCRVVISSMIGMVLFTYGCSSIRAQPMPQPQELKPANYIDMRNILLEKTVPNCLSNPTTCTVGPVQPPKVGGPKYVIIEDKRHTNRFLLIAV